MSKNGSIFLLSEHFALYFISLDAFLFFGIAIVWAETFPPRCPFSRWKCQFLQISPFIFVRVSACLMEKLIFLLLKRQMPIYASVGRRHRINCKQLYRSFLSFGCRVLFFLNFLRFDGDSLLLSFRFTLFVFCSFSTAFVFCTICVPDVYCCCFYVTYLYTRTHIFPVFVSCHQVHNYIANKIKCMSFLKNTMNVTRAVLYAYFRFWCVCLIVF